MTKRTIIIFTISLYIHDISSRAYDLYYGFLRSPNATTYQ